MSATATGIVHQRVASADGTVIGYRTLGSGPGLIVVGGTLRSAVDYLPLARSLAGSFEVHVMDRRGRGLSDAQDGDYSISKEREDLLAVQRATGATLVFGHSFGGLVGLETARRHQIFTTVVVYEPGVSIGHQMPLGWVDQYERLVASGEHRKAFACMVKHAGYAPGPLPAMPLWAVAAILRLGIRGAAWAATSSLLETSLKEHREVAGLDAPSAIRFSTIGAAVILLGGAQSPTFMRRDLLGHLQEVIPGAQVELLEGLGHAAPSDGPPEPVAAVIRRHLTGASVPRKGLQQSSPSKTDAFQGMGGVLTSAPASCTRRRQAPPDV